MIKCILCGIEIDPKERSANIVRTSRSKNPVRYCKKCYLQQNQTGC